jgi:hypothetical protein
MCIYIYIYIVYVYIYMLEWCHPPIFDTSISSKTSPSGSSPPGGRWCLPALRARSAVTPRQGTGRNHRPGDRVGHSKNGWVVGETAETHGKPMGFTMFYPQNLWVCCGELCPCSGRPISINRHGSRVSRCGNHHKRFGGHCSIKLPTHQNPIRFAKWTWEKRRRIPNLMICRQSLPVYPQNRLKTESKTTNQFLPLTFPPPSIPSLSPHRRASRRNQTIGLPVILARYSNDTCKTEPQNFTCCV